VNSVLVARLGYQSEQGSEIGVATIALVESYLRANPSFKLPEGLLERIESFAVEVYRWGARFNLTAAPDDPNELAFHILDSLMPLLLAASEPDGQLARCFIRGKRILDLGSGAGFPGLILASAVEAEFLLVESRRKRASFLRTAIGAMRLSNVQVDSQHRQVLAPEFNVVMARAFARPGEFYDVAPTGLKPDGATLLYASERQREEIEVILQKRGSVSRFYNYQPPRFGHPTGRAGVGPAGHIIVLSGRGT
jgi:16S rRNA (guanine527-N7)-methyltransferase